MLLELLFTLTLIYLIILKQQKQKHEHPISRKEMKQRKKRLSHKRTKYISQSVMFQYAKESGLNNTVTRHLQESCVALDKFDRSTPLGSKGYKGKKDEYF